MFKRLARSRYGQEALGFLLASYLLLVQRTSRFVSAPADLESAFRSQTPAVGAMWHGQHLMLSFAWPRAIARVAALISRSGDGGMQAAALRRLGDDCHRQDRPSRKTGRRDDPQAGDARDLGDVGGHRH